MKYVKVKAIRILGELLTVSIWIIPGLFLTSAPLVAQSDAETRDERESRLALATGEERLSLLGELTGVYLENDPARAAAFGVEALELLRTMSDDVELELEILNNLSRAYQILQRYGRARQWAARAERLARASENKSALATALIHHGAIHRLLHENEEALDRFLEALKLLEEIEDLPRQAYALNTIGLCYTRIGFHSEALDYYMRSYRVHDDLGDAPGVAMTLLNMGTLQVKLDNEKKALQHLRESMEIFDRIGMSIASPLRNIGEILMSQGEYEDALRHFQKALDVRKKEFHESVAGRRMTYALRLARALRSVCLAYVKTGRPNNALEYCGQALALQEQYGDKRAQASTLDNIGQIHRLNGDYVAAVTVLEKAIAFAAEVGAKGELQSAHRTLSSAYAAMGQHEMAYRELELYDEIKSEVFSEDTSKMIAEMEARFEADRRERENVILKQEQAITSLELERLRTSRGALGTGLVLLIIVFITGHSLYRLQAERRHKSKLEQLVEQRTAELKSEKEAAEEAREKLRNLDKLKSKLFANISHEFRTPLTLTLGPLRDLRDGKYGTIAPAALDQIELARTNAERVLDLINQLLDLARLEAGRLELRVRRGDLVAFLRRLYERFSPLAERRRITFRFDIPSAELELYFDPDQLDKVFSNLLSNAFKFTPEGGAVGLSLVPPLHGPVAENETSEKAARWVAVRVRDNGPGIPAGEVDKIFDRYYQAESSAPRHWPGSGLGLALAKDLTELHGGQLEVESAKGLGTTFAVELRLGRDHFAAGQVVDDTRPQEVQNQAILPVVPLEARPAIELADLATKEDDVEAWSEDRTTVLVVDDHPELRSYIRRQLDGDYCVEEAADGARGLEMARELLPDLVVSDVMMPELDGYALCQALKEDPELEYVPVILLTARAEPRSRLRGLNSGADDFLTKPFDARELKARVDNLIALRRRLQARFERGPALRPVTTEVVSADTAFLERVQEVIEAGVEKSDFNVDTLANRVGMDRSHLYRRLRALVCQTPSELIRTVRLERAEQMVRGNVGSISEIAYLVGFKSVAHFSRSFRERFGTSPSAYRTSSSSSPAV